MWKWHELMLEDQEFCSHHCRMVQMMRVGRREVNSSPREETRVALV